MSYNNERRKLKSDKARERIIDCALHLIGEKGYDAVTVSDITSAAGVSKGAFYIHFKSKEDIISQRIRLDYDIMKGSAGQDFEERIIRFVSESIRHIKDTGLKIAQEWFSESVKAKGYGQVKLKYDLDSICEIVGNDQVARQIVSTYYGALNLWCFTDGRIDPEPIAAAAVRGILATGKEDASVGEDRFTLSNGVPIPSIGIGTFLLEPKSAEVSVCEALKAGYRMVDTANAYVNERAVARGIRMSGVRREDVFISTKLWASEYSNLKAVDQTLERLDTDYVDLLFIHQPTSGWRDGYRLLLGALESGKAKAIGVSNFEGEYLDSLIREFDILPQVMQVECHPFYPQTDLRRITDKHGIRLMAWYPLGGKGQTSELLNSGAVSSLAAKHKKSAAQIVLRWHVQMGNIVIPGSNSPEHIKSNLDIFDFELTEEDMSLMARLDSGQRRYVRTDDALKGFEKWQPEYEKA